MRTPVIETRLSKKTDQPKAKGEITRDRYFKALKKHVAIEDFTAFVEAMGTEGKSFTDQSHLLQGALIDVGYPVHGIEKLQQSARDQKLQAYLTFCGEHELTTFAAVNRLEQLLQAAGPDIQAMQDQLEHQARENLGNFAASSHVSSAPTTQAAVAATTATPVVQPMPSTAPQTSQPADKLSKRALAKKQIYEKPDFAEEQRKYDAWLAQQQAQLRAEQALHIAQQQSRLRMQAPAYQTDHTQTLLSRIGASLRRIHEFQPTVVSSTHTTSVAPRPTQAPTRIGEERPIDRIFREDARWRTEREKMEQEQREQAARAIDAAGRSPSDWREARGQQSANLYPGVMFSTSEPTPTPPAASARMTGVDAGKFAVLNTMLTQHGHDLIARDQRSRHAENVSKGDERAATATVTKQSFTA